MDTTAQDLFDKLKGQFKNLTLGREDGSRTLIPGEAAFFEFDYHDDKSKLGSVVVSLVDEGSLKVYFADNIMDDAGSEVKDNWYSFLRGLRKFSTQNMINYEAKNISKQRLDKGDFTYLAKQNKTEEELTMESKLYGGKQRSYQDLNGAKLIIQHHNNVDEDKMGSRSRNVRAVYIENSDGERFKFENNYLPGARAMARHVSNGGYPRDEFGTHISEIMAEMTELRSFVRGVKGKDDYVNEDAQDIIEKATGRYYGLKSTLESVSKQRGYKDYFENYEPTNFEVSEDDINDLKQKLTREVFDSKLENSLGAVSKAMKHSTQLQEKKSGDFYDWDDWLRSAKQNGAEIEGDISGAVAIVNGKEIGEWNQDEQDVTGDKIASRFKKPGYGELNVDGGDRGDAEEREFIVPGDLQLRGEPTIDAMQYKDSPNLLNLILTDIASRAVDDEAANFAAKMAEKIGSVGSAFGQDPKDPAYQADKKKSVALAKMYIAQMKKKDESVEEDEAPFEETTKADPFEAYAASMDRIAEYDVNEGGWVFNKDGSYNTSDDEANEFDEYEAGEEENNPVVNAISGRITRQRIDLLKDYGLDKVMQAIDEVAEFVGDVEEIGSSDVSGWVKHVEQMLTNMEESVKKVYYKKPDFLDLDGDGDKEEPMKKAVKDKEKVKEAEGETIHAWWETEKGPGGMLGQALRYFKKNEDYDPDAAGLRNGPYFTPSLDWWPSVEDFEQGKQGFSNKTKDDAEGWKIHDRKSDALAAIKGTDEGTVEEGNFDSFESPKAGLEEDDMAWLRKAAGIGSGAKSNHGIHEGEEGYQITPRSLVAREMRKLQDLAKKD